MRPGGHVMGVDWRINIGQAWMDIRYRCAVQGNLDPAALFAPLPELKAKVHELMERTGTRPGHIINLGSWHFAGNPPWTMCG